MAKITLPALTISVLRAPSVHPAVLSIETGNRIAYFAGGLEYGELYATSDGTSLHRRVAPSQGLRGVRIIGDELWLTGEWTLAWSLDRGASWTPATWHGTPCRCSWDIARGNGMTWVQGVNAEIFRSWRRTTRFEPIEHGHGSRDERSHPRIEVVPAGVMFLALNRYWDGANFMSPTFVEPKGLAGANCALAIAPSGTIIIVGDRGAAFRSTDGGRSYAPVDTRSSAHLEDVAFVAGRFIAVGDKGTLRCSEDDGVTWKPLASGVKEHLWSIGSWGGGAFVGGEHGLILRIDSTGDTYWNGAPDVFAPREIEVANLSPLVAASTAKRDKRFAKLAAEAAAAIEPRIAKLAPPKHELAGPARAILANLEDVDEYKVYGDALEEAGDPRGELIALQVAGKAKAAGKYLARHRAALLGALAALDPTNVKLEWANGFITKARIAYDTEPADVGHTETATEVIAWLVALLDEPSAQLLQDLTIGIVQPPAEIAGTWCDNGYDRVIQEIARRARPALRRLFLGDFEKEQTLLSRSSLGTVTKLCAACARLEVLKLKSGPMNLGKPGQLVFPRLRELTVITGGLTRSSLAAIAAAHLPSLEVLELYFGMAQYGCDVRRKDVVALLASERFPRLRRLGLVNGELADELCSVLHLSPLVAQLEELDLSQGTLSDIGATALVTYAKGLAHLAKLDVSRSYVSPALVTQLSRALPNTEVVAESQRGTSFDERYVSLGE